MMNMSDIAALVTDADAQHRLGGLHMVRCFWSMTTKSSVAGSSICSRGSRTRSHR